MSLAQQLAAAAAGPLGAVPAPARGLALATLGSWLVSVGSGSYMVSSWLARGGAARYRANRQGLPPGVIFTHLGLAVAGLASWALYLATGWLALAWTAAGVLLPVTGLGLSAVLLWVPYPAGTIATGMLTPPAEDVLTGKVTDATLTRALTDRALAGRLVDHVVASAAATPAPRRRPWSSLAALLPVAHGAAAITTILLTMMTAASAVAAGAGA